MTPQLHGPDLAFKRTSIPKLFDILIDPNIVNFILYWEIAFLSSAVFSGLKNWC